MLIKNYPHFGLPPKYRGYDFEEVILEMYFLNKKNERFAQ